MPNYVAQLCCNQYLVFELDHKIAIARSLTLTAMGRLLREENCFTPLRCKNGSAAV